MNFEGIVVNTSDVVQVEVEKRIEQEIAAAAVDLQIPFVAAVANIKAFAIVSDVDLTVKTNSAGVPDETFNLLATKGQGFVDSGSGQSMLSTDLTDFYVSNPGATVANFKIVALIDTP